MNHLAVNHRTGILLVMLAGTFWSLGGLIIRLMEAAGPWQILFYRSLSIAVMLFVVLNIVHGRNFTRVVKSSGWASVIAGIGIAIAFAGFILSISYTTAANTFFLLATQPILIAIIAWPILGERVNRATQTATFVVLCGVAIMVAEGLALGTLFGNIMGLVSALGFTIFTIALRWEQQADMMPSLLYGSTIATCVAALALTFYDTDFRVTLHDGSLCALLGIIQIGLGTWCYTIGSRAVPAAELGLLAMTEIVLGPIWVWLFLAEMPTIWTLVGGTLIIVVLCCLAVMQWRKPQVMAVPG